MNNDTDNKNMKLLKTTDIQNIKQIIKTILFILIQNCFYQKGL